MKEKQQKNIGTPAETPDTKIMLSLYEKKSQDITRFQKIVFILVGST